MLNGNVGNVDNDILNEVLRIQSSGIDKQSWIDGGASEEDITEREIALNEFVEKNSNQKKEDTKKEKLKG